MPEQNLPRSRERIARENREELESWIEERVEQLIADGAPPDEARRQAQREFGDVDHALHYADAEDAAADRVTRARLWVEELASDLRIAARTLARTPTVTAVVLLTFALGIGATTSVFSVFHALLLRPLPYGEADRLAYIPAVDNGVVRGGLGGARHGAETFVALRERATSFTDVATVSMGVHVLMEGEAPEQVLSAWVTPNAFDVMQARAAIGRTFDARDPEAVVLLDGFWRRRFNADTSIVGRTITFGEGEERLVVGVMSPAFRVPTYEQAEMIAPQGLVRILASPVSARVRNFRLIARLKAGVSWPAAQADVERVMQSLRAEAPQDYNGIEARVLPIRIGVTGSVRPRLVVLMGAAAFLLLIACANVAGILLSRALARGHELSLRVALGAGRGRLLRQFMAEGLVLGIGGIVLGTGFAALGISGLRLVATTALPPGTSFSLEPTVLGFAVVAAITSALACSFIPALTAGRVSALGIALRRESSRSSLSSGAKRVRLGLVAAQLAVSVVLLVGAGLFLRTLHELSRLDLGYSTERALTFRPRYTRRMRNPEQDAFYEAAYAQLRTLPGVVAVAGGNVPTGGESTVSPLAVEGRDFEGTRPPDVRYTPVSDDYFAALGVPLLRGRAFNAADRDSAAPVAIVSAGLAGRLWPNGDALGARVRPDPTKPWMTVVGIVGDVRVGASGAHQPSVYTSQRQDKWRGASEFIVRAEGDPRALMAAVRGAMRRVDPTIVIPSIRTLDDVRASAPAVADRRLQMHLILAFAIIALVVSAIGVYGVGAYATEARRREFGIRMALGATPGRVLVLAMRDAGFVAVLGALMGIPVALTLASAIRETFFEVRPFDPLTIGVVLVTMLLVVFVASLVPARRATRVNPVSATRAD